MSSNKDNKVYRFQREVLTTIKTIEIIEVEAKDVKSARLLLKSSEPVDIYEEYIKRDELDADLLNIDTPYQDLTWN